MLADAPAHRAGEALVAGRRRPRAAAGRDAARGAPGRAPDLDRRASRGRDPARASRAGRGHRGRHARLAARAQRRAARRDPARGARAAASTGRRALRRRDRRAGTHQERTCWSPPRGPPCGSASPRRVAREPLGALFTTARVTPPPDGAHVVDQYLALLDAARHHRSPARVPAARVAGRPRRASTSGWPPRGSSRDTGWRS